MTDKEMARLIVAERLIEGEITIKGEVEALMLSTRQVKRVLGPISWIRFLLLLRSIPLMDRQSPRWISLQDYRDLKGDGHNCRKDPN